MIKALRIITGTGLILVGFAGTYLRVQPPTWMPVLFGLYLVTQRSS